MKWRTSICQEYLEKNYISFVLSYFLRREKRNYYFSMSYSICRLKTQRHTYWRMTLIYGYAQNVTKVSAASIIRLLQKKMVTPKKHHIVSWRKMYGTDGMSTVDKKAEKVREIGTRITLRSSPSNGIFRQNDGNSDGLRRN